MNSTALFTFEDLIQRVAPGFDSARWKVIRHLDASPDAPDFVELFQTNREAMEFYQSFQSRDILKDCEGFFSFVGLPNDRAVFAGAYRVVGQTGQVTLSEDEQRVPVELRSLWKSWISLQKPGEFTFRYNLERDERFELLTARPVIEWGGGARAWHQWTTSKAVVALREPACIAPCPDFRDIDISLRKIAFLAQHEEANPTWPAKLGGVGGIYLLSDRRNNRVYVGQAGSESGGFWSRWKQYAAGTSGNKFVDAAVTDGSIQVADLEVTMSILEVIPLGKASKETLDRLENRWKERLHSRVRPYGLNDN